MLSPDLNTTIHPTWELITSELCAIRDLTFSIDAGRIMDEFNIRVRKAASIIADIMGCDETTAAEMICRLMESEEERKSFFKHYGVAHENICEHPFTDANGKSVDKYTIRRYNI